MADLKWRVIDDSIYLGRSKKDYHHQIWEDEGVIINVTGPGYKKIAQKIADLLNSGIEGYE